MENLAPIQVQSAIADAQTAVAASKLASRGRAGDFESGLKAVLKGLRIILDIGDELTEVRITIFFGSRIAIDTSRRLIRTRRRHGKY
jgi:hypothetical protein